MAKKKDTQNKKGCCRCHLNSLGSLGYCVVTLGLTAFIITTEVQQLQKYLTLPWPDDKYPDLELNIHIGLVGAAAVLIPFFFCASVFKIGNFANDGYKLGVHDGACSRDPSPLPLPAGGLIRGTWQHGGPTGPFLHLVISHALIMAKMVMEAATIRTGFSSKESVWSSELSSIFPQRERLGLFRKLESFSQQTAFSNSEEGTGGRTQYAAEFKNASSSFDAQGLDDWHIDEMRWGPLTPHLINYAFAHLIYAGRYAAVFWGTNKSIAFMFFFQLLLNATQNVFSLNGFEVLYKVQMGGNSQRILPTGEAFFLPFIASTALYGALQTLVLASGCVFYLYGYVKFESFLSAEKEKYHILSKHGHEAMWPYWPHCWSLTMLVLMTGAASPLLYEWTVVYRSSLDSATLIATCATVLHLFIWILFWMALTIKNQWQFKLRVQVSKTIVTNTHSIRLVNEVQLSHQAEDKEGPVMVIGSGKTYILQEESPKKALMELILTTLTEKREKGEEEEIYWLRPKPPTEDSTWTKKKASPGAKHKVTFHEEAPEAAQAKSSGSNRVSSRSHSESGDESEGDYARLRDVSFPGPRSGERVTHQKGPSSSRSLSAQQAREEDSVSVGSDFPAPPPELANPAHYPPPPDSPPPPLPNETDETLPDPPPPISSLNKSTNNTVVNIIRDALEGPPISKTENGSRECATDSYSPSSSVTPPDKRSDSGVHSQTSTSSSSGTHSKSGSSGSESCVPPPNQHIDLPPPPPPLPSANMLRCSSVDELCSLAPTSAVKQASTKSLSLQHGAVPTQVLPSNSPQQQIHHQAHPQIKRNQSSQQLHNSNPNNNVVQLNNNNKMPKNGQMDCESQSDASGKGRLRIEVVGRGYGFLPPSKFVASEPIYSDASTPVIIRRRSSITAVEPETPPYERSGASFTTFTEPQLPRAVLRGTAGLQHALGKALTVGAPVHKVRRPATGEAKHYTIGGGALPKGFHQPAFNDPRYFSVPAVKPQGEYQRKS